MEYDAKKIVALMRQKDLNQAGLAKKTGLSQPTIHALVHGVTKMPKAATLLQVANALGVSMQTLLKRTGKTTGDLQEDMLSAFQRLGERDQRALIAAAKALVGSTDTPETR